MSVIYGVPSGPRITHAYIGALPGGSGTPWNSTFLNYLGSDYGYSIPIGRINGGSTLINFSMGGRGQLDTLPWINLNCITLGFNQDVNVSSNSLSISGVVQTYSITDFIYRGYVNDAYYASWYFNQSNRPEPERISKDKIRVVLSASSVSNKTFNMPLAGAITNATWTTTGDATTSAGVGLISRGANNTNFSLRLNILPGDVNSDTAVAGSDRSPIRARRELTVSSGNYTPFCDVNGDGIIRSGVDTSGVPTSEDDLGFASLYLNEQLPTGTI